VLSSIEDGNFTIVAEYGESPLAAVPVPQEILELRHFWPIIRADKYPMAFP
jgi:hypothetical protein